MFKRKALAKLLYWKEVSNNKPMILRGARQVGKSTLAAELGTHYKRFININLERSNDAKFFKSSDNVNEILERILLDRNEKYIPGDTLLFIDEIQEVPECISLLRYFYEDIPELDVIAAGSLLEFAIGDVPSFPVGRVEQIEISPLDFYEFLEALEEYQLIDHYSRIPISEIAHDKLLEYYNLYIILGGMPEVISTYVDSERKISSIQKVYSSIWDNYVQDIEKYGTSINERKILRHIISTAHSIIDRITFNGFGNSNYKSREVGEAFRKLDKAGVINLIYPTSHTKVPLALNYKRKPKIQFLDTGLLNYASGIQGDLLDYKDMNNHYKGYLTNHMMIQEMRAYSDKFRYIPPFWTRENANANAEVDLLYINKGLVIPIEVKSGAKGRLRSLHEFVERAEHPYAVRLLANKFSIEDAETYKGKAFKLINIPYYAIGRLSQLLEYSIDLITSGK
jgi:predicted AAA+ superfamily ATPase